MTEKSLVRTESNARRGGSLGVTVDGQPIEKNAGIGGGAYEGSDRLTREMASWQPRILSADATINDGRAKLTMDARGRDLTRNSGPILGASYVHKDSIVGSQYRLNLSPAYDTLRRLNPGLKFDDKWAEEFQQEVEELFHLYAESMDSWIDVQRTLSFTGLIRMGVGCYFAGGEVLATCNWMSAGSGRPFSTAFQLVDCDRLSNPYDMQDTKFLRRGVELDRNGAPIACHIRKAYPNDMMRGGTDASTWERRPMVKQWGRLHTILLRNLQRPEQTRGVADMTAVLKETRMANKFHDTTLANAIANASFAAAIESELPPDMVADMLGASAGETRLSATQSLLGAIAEYARGGKNIEIDGVKIPHLFPGTSLKMYPAGTVGGIGTGFEESLFRFISAGLGISYEELTHDFSKTNYSGARAAANNTLRFTTARKREVADQMANGMFRNWFEEALESGMISTMRTMLRKSPDLFYEKMNRDALCRATWIGASRGQVDETKETQAAIMRINSGLSTYEIECARLGYDFREIYRQQKREKRLREEAGLSFDTAPKKPGTITSQQNTGAGDNNGDKTNADPDDGLDD